MARRMYKHVNNTDVAAEFLEIKETKKGYKVKVQWINIVNPKNFYFIDLIEEIFIRDKDLKNWKVLIWKTISQKKADDVQSDPKALEIKPQQNEAG